VDPAQVAEGAPAPLRAGCPRTAERVLEPLPDLIRRAVEAARSDGIADALAEGEVHTRVADARDMAARALPGAPFCSSRAGFPR
jgi:hypothetical protein